VSDERPAVLVVGTVADDVADAVAAAGHELRPVARLEEAPAGGGAVAVVVEAGLRHVGLDGLGIPVLVVVDEGGAGIEDALARGAFDVVRRPLVPGEVAARLRAAATFTTVRRALDEASRTDLLTGLATRRHVDEHLEMVSSMARRMRTPFSLLMVDVDRTRRINDEHGHTAGDRVVAEVARRLASGLRSEDVAGRWGGEEFLVMLPHTPLDGAWRLADRIRATVCDEPISLGEGADVLVTVSVGCAEGYGDDLEDHLRRAATALDEAKAAGRNKVVAATA
jgi:two-component system, cell cycle response regulator